MNVVTLELGLSYGCCYTILHKKHGVHFRILFFSLILLHLKTRFFFLLKTSVSPPTSSAYHVLEYESINRYTSTDGAEWVQACPCFPFVRVRPEDL